MKKLKIILLFSILIYVVIITNNNIYKTKFNNETEIIGIVNKVTIKDSYTSIELLSKEKILCTINKELNIKLGTKIKVVGELKKPNINTNYNLFNYRNYLLSKKIKWIFQIEELEIIDKEINLKYELKNYFINKINNSRNKEYLKLFILGENELENETKTNYQTLGISHLFAISGMHITLLTGFLLKILNKISKNIKLNLIIIFIFLLFYLFLTNYSASVIRASLLFVGINIKKILKLKIDNENILLLILGILLIYNPYYIYDLGFVFSFSISYFLIRYSNIINNQKGYFNQLLMTSLIAYIVSIPIMINGFSQINLTSIILNCIFVPFVSIIVFPLSLLTFIFPFLEPILSITIFILESLAKFTSNFNILIIIPKIPIYIIILYYIYVFYLFNKFKYKKLIIIVIFIFITSNIKYMINYPILTMIDVGQGDSVLIELPHNKANILIDTGGIVNFYGPNKHNVAKNILIPYLKSIGLKQIDYLVITHGDFDHIGDAGYLINNYKVRNVILNSGKNNQLEKDLIKYLKKRNINYINISKYDLKIDKYEFNFINDKDLNNENEDSLIAYTNINNYNILLMGDAGSISEKYILDAYNLDQMDILKVGHHGSKYSSSEEFINKINPKISLISAGLNNKFGHPNKEAIERLNKSKIYITNKVGMIKLKLKKQIEISTCLFGYANAI